MWLNAFPFSTFSAGHATATLMATINVTDEELSAAKSCAEVLIAQQAARAPGDDDRTVLKKALVQVVLQRERERGRAFAEHLAREHEWTVKDYLASAYVRGVGRIHRPDICFVLFNKQFFTPQIKHQP